MIDRNLNEIHPTAIIKGDVKMGKGNKVHPFSIIEGPVEIGDDNEFGPYTLIGAPPTDSRRIEPVGIHIKIGDRNIIREYTVVEKPCYEECTIIENDVFIMQGVCIGHDTNMKCKTTAVNNVVTGGLTKILEGAYLAMGSLINQVTVVGHYSIVAAGSFSLKNVKPFTKFIPGKPLAINKYAIDKYGFKDCEEEINEYVFSNTPVKNEKLLKLIQEYEEYVVKYSNRWF